MPGDSAVDGGDRFMRWVGIAIVAVCVAGVLVSAVVVVEADRVQDGFEADADRAPYATVPTADQIRTHYSFCAAFAAAMSLLGVSTYRSGLPSGGALAGTAEVPTDD